MPDEESSDMKVFADQNDAQSCYVRLGELVGRGGFHSMSIYRVADAADTYDAAAAIRNREANRIELIGLKKAGSRWINYADGHSIDQLVQKFWSEYSA
jgi:hypothetical protein